MSRALAALWMPMASTQLLWLVVTLAAYLGAKRLQRALGGTPLANPVLLAIVIVAAVILLTGTPYRRYFAGAQFINFLLGPATVALGVPLARNLHHVFRTLRGVGPALLAGSLSAILSGAGIVWLLGGSHSVAMSMAPKAVTTPIAMAVSQEIGGIPALTAAFAIIGGILAAAIGQSVLRGLKVEDWRVHGFAAGIAGSGVAAAQVAPLDGLAAAFAALGIALNGILTSLVVPLLAMLWS